MAGSKSNKSPKNNDKDIVLLRELVAQRPFLAGYGNVENSWQSVVQAYSQNYPDDSLTVAAARSRFATMVADFKKEERLSKKASGISEEYSEWKQLLTEVTSLLEQVILESVMSRNKVRRAMLRRRMRKKSSLALLFVKPLLKDKD
jgi:hypothetical protein